MLRSSVAVQACTAESHWPFFERLGGQGFPQEHMARAVGEVETLCEVLQGEGVTVQRPDHIDFTQVYRTPDFTSPGSN